MEIGRWFKWALVETFVFLSLFSCLIKDLLSAWSLDFLDMLFVKKKCVNDKIVVITGGAGGIGRALGNKMAKMGAKVILIDINEKGINEAVRELADHGLKARAFSCDCTNIDQLKALAERIKNDHDLGKVNMLICCAGYLCAKTILDMNEDGLNKSFNINVISYFWAIKAFLPHMIENNQGHVVAISSIAGHFGQSYSAAYSASKFAIRGLMESLKWELDDMEQSGIKTTTIYPYFTQTALLSHVTPSSRFFENLSIDYTASNIISHILYEREEAFIPSIMSVFCLLIKQTSPPRVKSVWRKFFNVVYYTEDKPLKMNFHPH